MTFHSSLSKLLKKVVFNLLRLSSLLPSHPSSFFLLSPPFFLSFAVIFLLTLDFLKSSFRFTTRLKGRFREFSVGKESACNAGDPSLILGSGRSPGEGNGNPLQYSCLENPMDRGAWRATVFTVKPVFQSPLFA